MNAQQPSRRTLFARLAAGAVVALGAVGFTGCDDNDETTALGGGNGEATYTIGLSQANLAEPYRVQMNQDIEAAIAKYPNLKLIAKDAAKDSNKQRTHIEEFISQGVDLILISPNEPAPLTPPVAKAMAAGIPVIVLDRRLAGDDYTSFIGADNYTIGKAAGEWIVNELGGSGNVVELQGMMSTTPAQQRHQGFVDAIEGSGINVVFATDMRWDQSVAKSEMESALSRVQDIDLVYAHNDPGAYGAYLAAQAAGRADDIKFVGIDALQTEGRAYVQQGILDASFEYPTGGEKAVELARQILAGESVPKEVTLESRYFTPENIDQGGEPVGTPAGESNEAPTTQPNA